MIPVPSKCPLCSRSERQGAASQTHCTREDHSRSQTPVQGELLWNEEVGKVNREFQFLLSIAAASQGDAKLVPTALLVPHWRVPGPDTPTSQISKSTIKREQSRQGTAEQQKATIGNWVLLNLHLCSVPLPTMLQFPLLFPTWKQTHDSPDVHRAFRAAQSREKTPQRHE